MLHFVFFFFFFFNDTATTEIYTLSLHDALPIYGQPSSSGLPNCRVSPTVKNRYHTHSTRLDPIQDEIGKASNNRSANRSEEHTSELQSQSNLVCRLLLEKKKKKKKSY